MAYVKGNSPICIATGCNKPYYAKGYCYSHYIAVRDRKIRNTYSNKPVEYYKDLCNIKVLFYPNQRCIVDKEKFSTPDALVL